MIEPSIVRLHVESVALLDIPVRDTDRFAAVLGSELQRLLSEHGVPEALIVGGVTERLRAAPVMVLPAGLTARQLAEAVYAGWRR